jgi:hypothetical protein
MCSNQTPVARIEPFGPPRRAFALDLVVVLLPGNGDWYVVECDAAKPVTRN